MCTAIGVSEAPGRFFLASSVIKTLACEVAIIGGEGGADIHIFVFCPINFF
jgi:hypothetical protein